MYKGLNTEFYFNRFVGHNVFETYTTGHNAIDITASEQVNVIAGDVMSISWYEQCVCQLDYVDCVGTNANNERRDISQTANLTKGLVLTLPKVANDCRKYSAQAVIHQVVTKTRKYILASLEAA